MANTNVKPGRAPRAPKAPKTQPEAVEPKPETVEIEPENVTVTPEGPEAEAPEVAPEPEVTVPEPEPEPKQPAGARTAVYLVQRGGKYNVYRDTKKLTSSSVGLEKARLIARGYGESNPTIQ